MKEILRLQFVLCFLFIIAFIFSNSTLSAQNFTGQITDKNNIPVYGSTVFIKEANQGLACNDDGRFQTTLLPGSYRVEYKCLGYESVEETIAVTGEHILTRDIVLAAKTFDLAEVVISNKEDPAYEIMRKAIKQAPYHLNKVAGYEAKAYIKGNMGVTKVSGLIDKLSSNEGLKLSDIKDNLFLQESYSTIKFTAPDEYEQTVDAFSSTIPDDFDPENSMSIMQSSLYMPKFAGMVSPLNPKSFTYYRFRYEGFSDDNGEIINKIKIIPKLKDPELVQGYIYIAEDVWDIRYAELSSNVFGFQQDFIITYNEVFQSIYMPVTYSNKVDGGLMGIGAYFNYYASIKYVDIRIDTEASVKIEKKEKKKGFEIKYREGYSSKTDSLAMKRDSVFWISIRDIPLTTKEIHSYEIKDSVQQYVDSVRKKHHNSKFELSDLIHGGRIGGDSTKVAFEYDGLLRGLREYNFVDGFWLGQKFSITTKWNSGNNSFSVSPEIFYTTARKRVIWQTGLSLHYAPLKLGLLDISFGDTSADFNPSGVNWFDNSISTLLWGKNEKMLYRKKYIELNNKIDLTNGLKLATQIQIAKRSGLENNTEYSFFGGKSQIKPNIYFPGNFDLTSYSISVTYTPRYYYSIDRGRKYYRHAKSPTFQVTYSEGFSSMLTNNSRFRKLEAGISQSVGVSLFSKFRYDISGGTFLGDKDKIAFADFKHFDISNVVLMTKSPFNSFMLLDGYEASTNDYWVQGHLNYYSKYIFLKRLPFLQGKMFNEVLHFKYLYTPNKKNYTEIGYSIDIMESMSLGFHCSFDKLKYESFGVRFSVNTNLIK